LIEASPEREPADQNAQQAYALVTQ
jgi:hypothetical protein